MRKPPKGSLRVLMLVENCAYPQDSRVRSEAQTLIDQGHTVSVICPRSNGQPWYEEVNRVQVCRFPCPSATVSMLSYIIEFGWATWIVLLLVLWRWVREGLDVVHIHNPPDTLFVAALLPKLAGKRVIYDHHDLSAELYQAKNATPHRILVRVLRLLERCSCRVADRIIVPNESYRQHDMERNGVRFDRIWTVRNGPDLHRFPAELRPASTADSAVKIGYIGYIARQDGIDHLLHALSYLKNDLGLTNWSCVVIGPAEEPQVLEQLIADLALGNHVECTGYKPHAQALDLLGTVDIGVAPEPANSFNEKSTMIKIMEYMALAKPIIAYDLKEHRVTADEAALYALPNDQHDMARKIAQLIQNPELRARLGTIGRRRIEQNLSWKNSAQALVNCYNSLTQHPTAKHATP
ncbi:MAG: glycosyltransferase family 4 protein [Chloroflexi bacterium]|nr:glycosyltransferase family 4 protein [Chloroflexota bacterium]